MKSVLSKKVLQFFITIVIIVLTVLISIPSNITNGKIEFLTVFSFALNGTVWICLFIIELKKYPYSLTIMHWTFFIIFFFIAAFAQYLSGIYPWRVIAVI